MVSASRRHDAHVSDDVLAHVSDKLPSKDISSIRVQLVRQRGKRFNVIDDILTRVSTGLDNLNPDEEQRADRRKLLDDIEKLGQASAKASQLPSGKIALERINPIITRIFTLGSSRWIKLS